MQSSFRVSLPDRWSLSVRSDGMEAFARREEPGENRIRPRRPTHFVGGSDVTLFEES